MTYHYKYNRTLLKFSKSGRTDQTDAEKLLWRYLRNRQLNGYKFRRQYPIYNYILDFYCVENKIAIELDGSQHEKRKIYDEIRTKELQKLGIRVIRFWDNDVLQNIDGVLEQILMKVENISNKKPHPGPLLKGEGKSYTGKGNDL